MRSPDTVFAHATPDSRERAVAPCTVYALKYLRLIHYQISELDVIIQAAETQATNSGITAFSRVVSVSESMMGRRCTACFGGSDYYCQLVLPQQYYTCSVTCSIKNLK